MLSRFEELIAKQPKARRGTRGEYSILCPFHKDRTPSMRVNVLKGVFRCWGCGEKGGSARLVRALQRGISRAEAELYFEGGDYKKEETTVVLPSEYVELCAGRRLGPEGKKALAYLQGPGPEGREIPPYLVEKFRLGYCATGRFAKRVIVPVTTHGVLSTFIARDYTDTAEKKVLYATGGGGVTSTLFGYDDAINREVEVIVVEEGWADALKTLAAIGVGTAVFYKVFGVVALGTNRISDEQISLLSRFQRFVVLMDNDKEGRRGGRQVYQALTSLGDVREAKLETAKDPGAAEIAEIQHVLYTAAFRPRPVREGSCLLA